MVVHAEVIGIAFKKMNTSFISLEVKQTAQKIADEIAKKLDQTSSNWEHKLTWKGKTLVTGSWYNLPSGSVLLTVHPQGTNEALQIWTWVDEGTRPHVIRARNAPRLAFRSGYTPRTTPRQFQSGQARRFGPLRRPLFVNHPGTKARNWKEQILDDYARNLGDDIQGAINRGTRGIFS